MRLLPAAVLAVALASAAGCASTPNPRERQRAEIHYDLGLEALRASKFQEALKELDIALAAIEEFPEAHVARGLVMELGFGKLGDAERHYRRAIALRPQYPEAQNNLGQLLAKRGRLEEAIAAFDAALGDMMYREPYVARCNKGEALVRLGRRDEGIAELETCVKLAPRYCLGHRMLGRAHLEGGRTKAAIASFERYAHECPTAADAWYQVALAQLKAGEATKASEAFGRCEELAGESELGRECARSREMLQ
jgi:type IV pilus biogenesis/stability protein PilW